MDASLSIYKELSRALARLKFAEPVDCVYDPLDYAWPAFAQYVERYGRSPKEVVLVGMNPGPFGMVQTGVPFGEVSLVRDWLKIDAPIGRPARCHPKRPVLGFECARSEVSGARLWGWAKARFREPEIFFERFFIAQYCPLAFMGESGVNITPDKLAPEERARLEALCDGALSRFARRLAPKLVVGIGAYAAKRCALALAGSGISVGQVLHPSPASPAANRGWSDAAEAQLRALGVALPPQNHHVLGP